MKVLVCGGRDFNDYEYVSKVMHFIQNSMGTITEIIHGGAFGADDLADTWGKDNFIFVKSFPAQWLKYGPSAGPRRNSEMLKENPDYVVSFPGGEGTMDMRHKAYNAGIPIYVFDGKSLKYDFLKKFNEEE